MPARVLHVYNDWDRPLDQLATRTALETEPWPDGVEIVHEQTPGQLGYAQAVAKHWDYDGDLIICEQDIVPTVALVDRLIACPGEFCAYNYRLTCGVPWADLPKLVGLGLCKMTACARKGVAERPAVPMTGHRDFSAMLPLRLPEVHVHWQLVEHHHDKA